MITSNLNKNYKKANLNQFHETFQIIVNEIIVNLQYIIHYAFISIIKKTKITQKAIFHFFDVTSFFKKKKK